MKNRAFTLIELLVVIAIISILAALIFPITKAVNRIKIRKRAYGELAEVQTAINDYKAKLGRYPPDNPPNGAVWTPWLNPLFYELKGTTVTNTAGGQLYTTLDQTAQINNTALKDVFGPGVTSIANSSQPNAGDESRSAINCLQDLRPSSFMFVDSYVTNGMRYPLGGPTFVLGSTIEGPLMLEQGANGPKINPWRYNSTSPTNNPSSFDLWIDVTIDGKTQRISNWSTTPQIMN